MCASCLHTQCSAAAQAGLQDLARVLIEVVVQAGTEDGSCFLRPMTDVELAEQSRLVAAA